MPYHVRITSKSDRSHDEVRLDLSEAGLRERVIQPYDEGRPIVIGGRTIPPDDIERVSITYTDESSTELLPIVKAERSISPMIAPISDDWFIADRGRDVTDDWITDPPGGALQTQTTPSGQMIRRARAIFVVHGRNVLARDAMFSFLRSIKLDPLEWIEAMAATGKPAPYVGEILTAAFDLAHAVVVLMTPDDLAYLKEDFRHPGDPPHEVEATGQARPNVLFEAGMAMGRDENRTVLVELGALRPFSDVGGRHVIWLNNTTQRRQEFATRLQAAGCPVDLTGTDWHSAGDFDAAVK
jgi:predicted nucleotide-binding protein